MTTKEEWTAVIGEEITEAMVDGIELAFDYMLGCLRKTAREIADLDLPCAPAQADVLFGAISALVEIQPELIKDVRAA